MEDESRILATVRTNPAPGRYRDQSLSLVWDASDETYRVELAFDQTRHGGPIYLEALAGVSDDEAARQAFGKWIGVVTTARKRLIGCLQAMAYLKAEDSTYGNDASHSVMVPGLAQVWVHDHLSEYEHGSTEGGPLFSAMFLDADSIPIDDETIDGDDPGEIAAAIVAEFRKRGRK